MYKYKKSILFLLVLSFLFSHQYENYLNGAIPSATKTPQKGKVNFGLYFGGGMLSQNFNQDGDLVNYPESTNFSKTGLGFTYHGFHGAGIKFMFNEHAEYGNDSMVGVYFVWNEMYNGKNPALIPWQHSYTSPLTRIVTELRSYQFNGESYAYLIHYIDFLLTSKSILSSQIALSNDTQVAANKLILNYIHDITNNFSISGGLNYYLIDNSNKVELSFKGGYQFKDVAAGNLKMNFKLIPEVTYVISGKNADANHNFKLNLQTYFN